MTIEMNLADQFQNNFKLNHAFKKERAIAADSGQSELADMLTSIADMARAADMLIACDHVAPPRSRENELDEPTQFIVDEYVRAVEGLLWRLERLNSIA